MNDRYLYRAKRTSDGQWEIGSLICLPDGEYEIANKCTNPPDSDPMWKKCVITHKVDTSTICQCTGLKDKNGKLIWENDIVKHDFGEDKIGVQLAIVKYDSKYACYQIKPIYDWMYCDKSDCEVIGNIFDNPELLEVGE